MGYAICVVLGVVAGFLCTAAVAAHGRKKRPKRRREKNQKRKFEFSKLVLLLVLSTYFVGVFVGIKVVFIDVSQLGAVLAFIGTPTATAIAFYCWKAKAENLIKIKKDHPEASDAPLDLNNIVP